MSAHRPSRTRHLLVLLPLLAVLPVMLVAQQATFRSGVDLVRLDVSVVSADGTPIGDLRPEEFEVRINGAPRPVESVQFLTYGAEGAEASAPQPGDFTMNVAAQGRLLLVLVDEGSLHPLEHRALLEGLSQFFDGLRPGDKAALFSIPAPTARIDFTSDVSVLKAAVMRLRAWPAGMAPREPINLSRGEGQSIKLTGVAGAEDARTAPPLTLATSDTNPVLHTLAALADALRPIPGPKTLLLVARGLPGGLAQQGTYDDFARRAAAARLKVYALRQMPAPAEDVQSGTGSNTPDPVSDPGGMHQLAEASGGAVFDAISRATGVLERIHRETTAGYLLGVRPPDALSPKDAIKIDVKVTRPGVLVRARSQTVVAAAPATAVTPGTNRKAALRDVLRQPRPATELSLWVSSQSARGADGQIKTVFVIERPESDTSPLAAWGYEVLQGERIVVDAFEDANTTAASRVLVTTTSLPPGSYRVRFAAVEADGRRGSVEHPVTAALHGAAPLQYSDVFAGEAVDGRFQPRIRVRAAARELTAFIELYAANDAAYEEAEVEFTLVDAAGATHAAERGAATAGSGKRIVQAQLPIDALAPGRYHVVATVFAGGEERGSVRRTVWVE